MNTSVIKPGFNCIKAFQSEWITTKINEAGIDYLENLGFHLCDKRNVKDFRPGRNGVSTSQMRNLFSEIKRIELKLDESEDWKTAFLLLRPKIAYNAARVLAKDNRSRMKDLKEVLEKAHRLVQEKEQFVNFSRFMEGIIAYHKVYGGKD